LTARENVSFAARLYDIPDPDRAADVALERMRVLDRANTPVRQLSRGLQQRVSIARAFVHTPQVVLLDEPFTGLDALGAEALSDALRALMETGAALVLVTHSLDEGLALATRTAVMRGGRLIRTDERASIDVDAFGLWYRAALA
jgi:heme exporter protein A